MIKRFTLFLITCIFCTVNCHGNGAVCSPQDPSYPKALDQGTKLSDEQAAQIEKQLEISPKDNGLRLEIMGFYQRKWWEEGTPVDANHPLSESNYATTARINQQKKTET